MKGSGTAWALALAGVIAMTAVGALAQTVNLQSSIPNPSPDANDLFGQAVWLSGGVALIGASSDGTTGAGSGQAYLYDAGSGTLLHTLANPGAAPTASDNFGLSVALAGNLAVVGAQNDDTGTTNAGAAYLFNASTGALQRSFTNPHAVVSENFGHAVAVAGNQVLISAIGNDTGAANSGAAYVFDATSGALLKTLANPTPAASDNFGYAVALSGNRALVSTISEGTAAKAAGAAYLFDTTTGALLQTFLNPTPELNNAFGNNDNFGFSVALSSTRVLIGAPNDGANGFHNGVAYLYDIATGTLLNTLEIPNPNSDTEEFFGSAVALSEDVAVIGAPFRNLGPALAQKDVGAAFVFDADTGQFIKEIDDLAPVNGDRFGFAVAADGTQVMVGAQTDSVGGIAVGQAFTYEVAAAVPEPGSVGVLLAGGGMLLWGRRRGRA